MFARQRAAGNVLEFSCWIGFWETRQKSCFLGFGGQCMVVLAQIPAAFSAFSILLSSLELSDSKVYAP
jgi:hypothetical protein